MILLIYSRDQKSITIIEITTAITMIGTNLVMPIAVIISQRKDKIY